MAPSDRVVLESSWKDALSKEFDAAYLLRLRTFLIDEKRAHKTVYPAGLEIFNALDSCPLPDTRVVIIGQDPYHGPHQAHGLCFSVPRGVAPPPSLENIFREIEDDMGNTVLITAELHSFKVFFSEWGHGHQLLWFFD